MKKLFLLTLLISLSAFCGHQMEIVFKDKIISAYVNDRIFVYGNKPYVMRYFNESERFQVITQLKESVNIFMVNFQVVEIPSGKIFFFCKEIRTNGNAEIGMALGKAYYLQYQKDKLKIDQGKFTMVRYNSFNAAK